MNAAFVKLRKLANAVTHPLAFKALIHGTAPAIEHKKLLRSLNINTVIDIGANKGQFTLVAMEVFSDVKVIAFEPLRGPSATFRRIFKDEKNVALYQCAIGPESAHATMNISASDDSSSLLEITDKQTAMFPNTEKVGTEDIRIAPLSEIVSTADLRAPLLLKIDVQGYELEVLKGCVELLKVVEFVLIECSFIELYGGQPLADDVIRQLQAYDINLAGIYNLTYSREGLCVQGDFFFCRGASR